jgi:hypothetical protein
VIAHFDRAAHTPLMLLSDEEFATGLARLHAADPPSRSSITWTSWSSAGSAAPDPAPGEPAA